MLPLFLAAKRQRGRSKFENIFLRSYFDLIAKLSARLLRVKFNNFIFLHLRAAIQIKAHVEVAARELSFDNFGKFENDLYQVLFRS